MAGGRRTQTSTGNELETFAPLREHGYGRDLAKTHLGGVVFGCTNTTMKECLKKQLFGLPGQHFSYVQKIGPGLPLFLFNYSNRSLYGIYEAASCGRMNIDPYAWTNAGAERTEFPAQVQIYVKLQCHAVPESQFKPIIADNYYNQNHFWFELDHAQTSMLLSMLSSAVASPSNFFPQNSLKVKTIWRALPLHGKGKGNAHIGCSSLKGDSVHLYNVNSKLDTSNSSDGNYQTLENCLDVVGRDEKELIYLKLEELVHARENMDSTFNGCEEDIAVIDSLDMQRNGCSGEVTVHEEEMNGNLPANSSEDPPLVEQLLQKLDILRLSKTEQTQRIYSLEEKISYLEAKLVEAQYEIQRLKGHIVMLEQVERPPIDSDRITPAGPSSKIHLEADDLILVVGGYDGSSWLSALQCYSPSQDLIKSFKPTHTPRSYASVSKLNGELYVFGGGAGNLWYDTVESYDLIKNRWISRPKLNEKKGSLAGATVKDKIFAIGGGNGTASFSRVEMLDLDVGRWIPTRSMLQKRFALAAVELNGAIYAVGGYDGENYLKTTERFDPREHSWAKVGSMNTKRGCHSLAVLNEKLYVLGGYDGDDMVSSMEIYDPRMGLWTVGESMNHARGYSAAAVVKNSIYIFGGFKTNDEIIDTIERYKEGLGWEAAKSNALGKRCFLSAIAL